MGRAKSQILTTLRKGATISVHNTNQNQNKNLNYLEKYMSQTNVEFKKLL